MTEGTLTRWLGLATVLAFLTPGLGPAPAAGAEAPLEQLPEIHVYKGATCGCCDGWVEHLEEAGFPVKVDEVKDMGLVKRTMSVPGEVASCHTALVGGYVVEGHVPADVILKLLDERPRLRGIAVPGMPIGSPGMEMGDREEPYQVLAFEMDGTTTVYADR